MRPSHTYVAAAACHAEATGPKGKTNALMILAYDPQSKAYKSFDISSDGEIAEPAVAVSGNTWIFNQEVSPQGKPARIRVTYEFPSATSLTTKTEMSTDGNTWTVVGEGKGTKIK